MEKKDKDKELPLLLHLEELRKRFIHALIAVGGGAIFSWLYTEKILRILVHPLETKLVFLSPQEAFITNIKIALFGGIILALPVIIHEGWKFVSIALKEEERKSFLVYGPLAFLLFGGGISFCYFVVLPLGLRFLLGFGRGIMEPFISVDKYISFIIVLLLAFGFIFELPIVMAFLSRRGIITPELLSQKRRVAIVSVFILAALLTPPDVFTQLLLAGPLIVLYEISIWASKLAVRKPYSLRKGG